MNIGLLGELFVEQKLVENDWHPVRLDTAQMAANADLIALKKSQRINIQVKTTQEAGSFSFGYAQSFLNNGTPFFNSKSSPIIADVVVGVMYNSTESTSVVLPIAVAEELCRKAVSNWYKVPKRNGSKRSPRFPVYLRVSRINPDNWWEAEIKEELSRYENNWDILSHPVERFHDLEFWKHS